MSVCGVKAYAILATGKGGLAMSNRGALIFACLVALGWYAVQPSAEERAEEKRQGFHCLSAWSGGHAKLMDEVKRKLRDPSSFEHVRTTVTPVSNEGTHWMRMTFRAKNGFGGLDSGLVQAEFANDDCRIRKWDFE